MVELLGVVVERRRVRLRNLDLSIRDLSFFCPFPLFCSCSASWSDCQVDREIQSRTANSMLQREKLTRLFRRKGRDETCIVIDDIPSRSRYRTLSLAKNKLDFSIPSNDDYLKVQKSILLKDGLLKVRVVLREY